MTDLPSRQAVLIAAIAAAVKACDEGSLTGGHWESTSHLGPVKIKVMVDMPVERNPAVEEGQRRLRENGLDAQGLPIELNARIGLSLGVTPEALAPLLVRLRDAGLRVSPDWQPIETARRDGHGHHAERDIDLWHLRQGRIADCFWDEGLKAWMARSGGRAYNMGGDDQFSHWVPPPEPPHAP